MKEKTFEELIEEKQFDVDNFNVAVSVEDVLNLLQQVREATIAECADIELDSYSSVETQRRFDNLPTDRIKTEK